MILGKLLYAVGLVGIAASTAAAFASDFCIGWNIHNCANVIQPSIPLIQVGPVDVTCENCYSELQGQVVVGLDPFKIGFVDMTVDIMTEIDAQATGSWSFDKTDTKIIYTATMSEGPIHVTMNVPLGVNIHGSFKGDISDKISIRIQGDIGSWESIFKDGHWEHVIPAPVWKVTHSADQTMNMEGMLELTVEFEMDVKVDDIFEGGLHIAQDVSLEIQTSQLTSPGYTRQYRTMENSVQCDLCEFAMNWVEKKIASNQTESNIIAELEKVCDVVGELKTTCDAMIEQFFPLLVQMLLNKETPQAICTTIKMCGASKAYAGIYQTIPKCSGTVEEKFKIDWTGGIKLPILHIDKTFDMVLFDYERTIPIHLISAGSSR
jgi:hypothetical protein